MVLPRPGFSKSEFIRRKVIWNEIAVETGSSPLGSRLPLWHLSFNPQMQRPFHYQFGPRVHLLILRCSIIDVACFAFLFGTFFHLADYISMWWAVTAAVFTGGAGSAIIGGLYWKKGTAAGAWVAFLTGTILSISGIVVQQVYSYHDTVCPFNGTQIGFFASLAAVSVYIIVSLLTFREDFDLDRMLHRG